MAFRLTSWWSRPALLRTFVARARLALRLIRDPLVPLATKAVLLLAALYLIFPVDVVPDILPVLGQLDDLGFALVALEVFLRLCPASARIFHESAIAHGRAYSPMVDADDFIDAEWHRQ